MKQSSKTLRKMLAIALAVATIGSAGIMTEVGSFVGTNITAEAASYELHTYNNITYALYSDGTAEAVSYSGTNKDFSTTTFAMPSVIYSKNLGKDYILDRSQFTVTRMQADGFSGIKARIFSLPNSLQVLFGGFKNTEIGSFVIATNNAYFSLSSSAGGILLNKSGTEIVAYPSKPSLYYTGSDFIYIPNTVTRIGMYAFTSYKATSITIPSTVTYVDRSAFQYSSLQSITFSGNPDFYQASGESVCSFDDANNLSSITIKGTNGDYSTDTYGMLYNKDKTKFIYCPLGRTSAFNVADTCTEIVDWAFHKSSAKPVIYDNVTKISTIAFDGVKSGFKLYCLKDTSIETYAKNNNINYGYHFEYSTNSDGTLTVTKYSGPYNGPSLPEKVKGKTITAIGAEAFKGNTTLDGIYLSSTKITSIGDSAFYGCTKLKNIYLPSTVTSIGKKAFYNTIATGITIPSSMTEIGEEAFYGMFKLESISIPSKVTKIGTYAFGFDSALTSVTIPSNVKQINFAAFYGCSKLASLTIGSGVTTIGGSAFCNTALTSQYIPKNVTNTGSYVFGFKYADKTYTRDENFTEISGYPDTEAQAYAEYYDIPFKSLLQYSKSSDGKSIKIDKYTGTDTVVVIPNKIDGLPVTSIAGYAFDGTNVTSITLPSGMTALDGYALYGASKLTTVKFPSGLTSIGSYAFEFCTSLKSITIPNTVTSIGTGAFYGCNSLASVNLGTGVKTIGKCAFTNTALTSVTIPKSTTSIGEYAFGYTYSDSVYTAVSGFKMTGYAYTAADTYATNNSHITFTPLYESISNTSTISKTAITLGDSITINFNSTGGKKPMTYAAMYSLNGGSSVSICSYSTNTSTTFTPTKAGTYTIYTYAKDDRGQFVAKTFTLTVDTPAVKNTSTIWVGENQGATAMYADDSVGIAASATGGNSSYKYSVFYHIKGSNNWYTAIEDTTRTNISFKMTDDDGVSLIGECQILVTAKDTDGKFESKTFNMTVYDVLANTSEISAETITVGDSVTITASATGGSGGYTYKFNYMVINDEELGALSTVYNLPNTTENTCIFTPSDAGKYRLRAVATDSNGRSEAKVFDVVVEEATQQELVNTSYITGEDEGITLGGRIYVTPAAEGGAGGYTYAVLYKKKTDTKWVTKQNFSTNTENVSVLPSKAADYEICVKVKDADGTVVEKVFEVTVVNAAEPLTNTSTLSATAITKGESITVTASATGGEGGYLYQVVYKKKTDTKWTTKQNFAQNTTVTITPASAVEYDVCVKVKDSQGNIEKKFFEVTVTAQASLVNNSTISATSIVKGNTVKLTGAATGGTGGYTYSFLYKKKTDTKWTTKQGFAENNVVDIKPASAVEYDVCVKVKDSKGTVVKKFFELTVTQALASSSTISATSITKGQTVTVDCSAMGGSGGYTYAVFYKQKAQTNWTTKQNFTENSTVTIKPANATTYDVCVKVKDSDGTIAKQYFVVEVK